MTGIDYRNKSNRTSSQTAKEEEHVAAHHVMSYRILKGMIILLAAVLLWGVISWILSSVPLRRVQVEGLTRYSEEEILAASGLAEVKRMREVEAESVKQAVKNRTAWRIEGTLREFPKFSPVNMWFDYPCHKIDKTGTLEDLASDESFTSKGSPWKKNFGKKKSAADSKKEREASVETAYGACSINGPVTIAAMAEFMGVTEKTARNRIKEHGDFWIDGGSVGQK